MGARMKPGSVEEVGLVNAKATDRKPYTISNSRDPWTEAGAYTRPLFRST